MSRSKYYWYMHVVRVLHRYPDGLGNSIQDSIARSAINRAIADTAKLRDGEERLKLINLIYWNNGRVNRVGAAMQMFISETTAKRWDNAFIHLVAEYMGFGNVDLKLH